MRILLLNPNTSPGITALLDAAARPALAAGTELVSMTASRGVPYIASRAEAAIGGVVALELLAEHHAGFDAAIIAAAQTFVAAHGIAPGTFEFQMLYGIRRDLQAALAAGGYGMRVYIPFGREWFSYFMRRLGERVRRQAP